MRQFRVKREIPSSSTTTSIRTSEWDGTGRARRGGGGCDRKPYYAPKGSWYLCVPFLVVNHPSIFGVASMGLSAGLHVMLSVELGSCHQLTPANAQKRGWSRRSKVNNRKAKGSPQNVDLRMHITDSKIISS